MLEVELLPVSVVVSNGLLHVLHLVYTRFFMYLCLLPDNLDLLLLLILYLC